MIYIFGWAFDPPHAGHAAIVRAILHFKHPEKIVIIPSSERDDKKYHVSDEHRLKMLELFVKDIRDERVIIDDYFVKNWRGEMITKDVDEYARVKYGENLIHVFGADTIKSMPEWDNEQYAATKIAKLFVPREDFLKTPSQLEVLSLQNSSQTEGPHLQTPPKLDKPSLQTPFKLGELPLQTPPKLGGRGVCHNFISPKGKEYLKQFASDVRKNQTLPEKLMWDKIFSAKKFLGYKVLRQYTLGDFIVDFYIHVLRLVVEIDGDIHSAQPEKDQKRDDFFIENGYTVLRIPAFEVLYNIDGVYEFLVGQVTHPPYPPNLGGNSYPPCPRELRENTNTHPPDPTSVEKQTHSQNIALIKKNSHPLSVEGVENFEIFTETHFPDISSTEIRAKIPEYTHISRLYDDNLKTFKIPGLSKEISLYILENRLYRSHLPKEKLLVHVCCGPDVVMPILQMRDEYDIVCFWYDPNIQPKSEYDKRYEAFKKVCEIENIPFIKGAYDVKNFFSRIKWYEFTPEKTGEKCTRCYDMRMYVAAKLAKKLGIPNYTTSLNTSPKKDLDKMFFMGHKYAEQFGITFLDIPFRKRGGFELSAEYTKTHDIYRQNYCGCIYSIREGWDSDMKRRMVG